MASPFVVYNTFPLVQSHVPAFFPDRSHGSEYSTEKGGNECCLNKQRTEFIKVNSVNAPLNLCYNNAH